MATEKNPDLEDELDIDFGDAEVDSSPSAVARDARKNFLLLVIIIIASLIFIYYLFFNNKGKNVAKVIPINNDQSIVKPNLVENIVTNTTPSLPPPPPIELPKAPEPLPVIPEIIAPKIESINNLPDIKPLVNADPYKAVMEQRKRSSILLSGGGGSRSNDQSQKQDTPYLESDAFFIPAKTSAAQQKATRIGKIDSVIAQGKIIDAIIETALNTDLAGTIRAQVTRDVYAEAGKNILIPKGSRLIGTYPSNVQSGQNRISIIWTRLIRPDGIDLMIDSPGVDKLGRAGVEGILDNKYMEIFGNAILLSSLNIGFAYAADKITDAQPQTTTSVSNLTGGVTSVTTGTNSDSATRQAVTDMQSKSKQILDNSSKTSPTITIDQGTLVKVFVNRDLIFPANMSHKTRFVE